MPDSVMMGIYWHLKRQWRSISLIASLGLSAPCAVNCDSVQPYFPDSGGVGGGGVSQLCLTLVKEVASWN